MRDDQEEAPRRYVVVESDRFEADWDRAVLSVYRLLGPKAAGEWVVALSRALSERSARFSRPTVPRTR